MPLVPRPKSDNDTSINFRLPGAWLDEAQELVSALKQPSPAPMLTRQDVLRMALRKGLDELKRDAGKRKR